MLRVLTAAAVLAITATSASAQYCQFCTPPSNFSPTTIAPTNINPMPMIGTTQPSYGTYNPAPVYQPVQPLPSMLDMQLRNRSSYR